MSADRTFGWDYPPGVTGSEPTFTDGGTDPDCDGCNGYGVVFVRDRVGAGHDFSYPCPECSSDGEEEYDNMAEIDAEYEADR